MNGYLSLDNKTSRDFNYLAPYMSAMDLSGPGEITDNIKWPAPVVLTISNWFHSEQEIDEEKLKRMTALFI